MTARSYRQTRRAEATEGTRSKIVEAARDQLLSGEHFTIDAVARRASVTRATVYAQFATRDHLRDAVFDQLAASGGLTHIPEAFLHADAMAGLRRLVEIFCGFYTTHRTVLRRLNALAVLASAEGARQPDRNERRRHALTVLVLRVAQGAPLTRESAALDHAISTAHALTSFEFFDQIVAEPVDVSDAAARIFSLIATVLGAATDR